MLVYYPRLIQKKLEGGVMASTHDCFIVTASSRWSDCLLDTEMVDQFDISAHGYKKAKQRAAQLSIDGLATVWRGDPASKREDRWKVLSTYYCGYRL